MAQLDGKALRKQANDLLDRHEDSPKKLVLLHTAVGLLAPLVVMLINILLDQQIAKTGGLGGMDARSRLETIQSTLLYAVAILLPFWEVGLIFAAMQWRKGEEAEKTHLLEGFRRFVNVFALRFWSGVLFVVLGIFIFYASMFLYTMTPLAKPVMDLLAPTGASITPEEMQAMLTPELINQLLVKMVPMFILFAVLYAAVCIPVFYRLRFAEYILLEGEGGRRAMVCSMQLTKGSCWQIFKLDLQFWWFYLLLALSAILCYGDLLLPLAGVTLPMNSTVSSLLFYIAAILLQGYLYLRYQAQRQTTYALAYDALQPRAETPEQTPFEV